MKRRLKITDFLAVMTIRFSTTNNLSLKASRGLRIDSFPHTKLKGVFCGSGSDSLNHPDISKSILDLVDKKGSNQTNILYVGTATYDLPAPKRKQTIRFVEQGCRVQYLDIAKSAPSESTMRDMVENSHVIIVSGGNTLYAVDRWKQVGLDILLRQAMHRGVVLTGGSAGVICWFDGGHSDSMDPDTFRSTKEAHLNGQDERISLGDKIKNWEYIRIDGLRFLPGLVCPHYDKVQSNGVLRAFDFDNLLQKHDTEIGIGIDHWAALEVRGENFRVLSLPEKEGSVLKDEDNKPYFSRDRKGLPGIWIKEVKDGVIRAKLCPRKGKIQDLLRVPSNILKDDRVEICRALNPLPLAGTALSEDFEE
mmetsp:Transcript_21421/g.32370  ORF Transcript_21421/g.32370 Transcript_21421/m.32370 type:complete len:364 (-) Transcript_21421:593-1684(-)